ncbi:uncharacterized protein LOC34622663 [Cyclospora cayetanensis]|uniref:Iron-sulfur cluster assembly accessory n=2 Tax=Cyclospora cayetanensis TaxID=88456 RepID=A0A1D3D4Z1_9EIME|nr:uncharacterized protein LOC34622663 [Cyclospora cayetanensis]OEH78524.1 iron-sulfur cluster assembly accessory [Cyclospora cayetanensis]
MLLGRPLRHLAEARVCRRPLARAPEGPPARLRAFAPVFHSSFERPRDAAMQRAAHFQQMAGKPSLDGPSKTSLGPGESLGALCGPSATTSITNHSGDCSAAFLEFAEVYPPQSRRRGLQGPPRSSGHDEGASASGDHRDVKELPHKKAASPLIAADKNARATRRSRELPPLLSATEAAVAHIKELVEGYNRCLEQAEARGAEPQPRASGIRISLKRQGCSGMAYDVALYAEGALGGDSDPKTVSRGEAKSSSEPLEEAPTRRGKDWRVDEVVKVGEVEIRVAADAVMLLVGTQVDFVDEEVQTGFVFNNPNQKHSCGCGKSFMV